MICIDRKASTDAARIREDEKDAELSVSAVCKVANKINPPAREGCKWVLAAEQHLALASQGLLSPLSSIPLLLLLWASVLCPACLPHPACQSFCLVQVCLRLCESLLQKS